MNEIKAEEMSYLKEFDVHVKHYLTYAQIENIASQTAKMDMWAARQQNIDMMVLCYVTDIPLEKLQEIGPDTLLESGLVDIVKSRVYNYSDIYKALNYIESTSRAITQVINQAGPTVMTWLEGVAKKYGDRTKK